MNKFDREKFEEELKDMGIEYDPDSFKPDWWTRMLLKISPIRAARRLNKRMGFDDGVVEKAHAVFSKVGRVDIFPLSGHHRGFILVLDQKTAIFFYQDGDHFKYDGWETGPYARGDVMIFDNLPNQRSGPYDIDV